MTNPLLSDISTQYYIMFEKIAQVVSLSLAGAGVSWEREVEIIAGQSSFDLKSQCHFLYKQSLELAPLLSVWRQRPHCYTDVDTAQAHHVGPVVCQ